MKTLRATKVTVAIVMLAVTAKAAAWGCPPVIDSVWIASVTSGISSLTNGILGMVTGINGQNTINERRIMSALKVQTKQISSSAEKEIANMSQTMQAVATTMVTQDTAILTQRTMEDYGSTTGQGFDPCGEQSKSRTVSGGYQAAADVSGGVRGLDTGPGVYKDRAQTLAARMSEHKANFCTDSERAAGFCQSVGAQAGASLSFSTLFKTSDVSDATTRAKNAFVNNVFGLPDQPIDPSRVNTPEAQAALRDKMQRDGYRSIAATSFKSIQALTSVDGANGTNNNGSTPNVSFFDALKTKIEQYAGGNDYNRWEQSLTVQSERGLMVNLAKMSATRLYAAQVKYDQAERMEANLAALLALEAKGRASR